jgi:hypothetical protein
MATERTMGEQAAIAFGVAGGVFGVAALVSAYNTTVYPPASLRLGIAAAGFSLSAALCSVSAAWLLRQGQNPPPSAPGPSNTPSERNTLP